jgi:hypothetical protein
MKQLTVTLDDATFRSAELQAQKVGKSLTVVMLEWLKGFSSSGGEPDFDRLAAEEAALRERMIRQGRKFSGSDRLTRDELHDRHALR